MAPLGYDTRDRKITVNEAEAERVRTIFESYLRLGSLNQVMADLRKRGIVTKVRKLRTGETIGGIAFTRGPLAHLLRNRFYIGEVAFKGEVLAGEQPAIIDRELFDAVQAKLSEQVTNHKKSRTGSEALLLGRIFDDRGHRMSPSHVRKRAIKYRYYLSSALLQGRPKQAGTVSRIPAREVETLIANAVRNHLRQPTEIDDTDLINTHVVRVEVQPNQLVIELTGIGSAKSNQTQKHRHLIEVPWRKTPSTWGRESSFLTTERRKPDPSVAKAARCWSRRLRGGRRWLKELMTDPQSGTETIAGRERCSVRKINKTISLAFLAPDLVKAAINGRLRYRLGVARLCDLPAEWSRQRQILGPCRYGLEP
jgi:site-specific DNA recombinase